MGDIISLSSAHLPTGEADKGIVEVLKMLLEKAERGEIAGMALAWVEGQNDIVWKIERGFCRDALLIAAVAGMNHYIHDRWMQKIV